MKTEIETSQQLCFARRRGKERDDNESADGNISCRTLWNLQPPLRLLVLRFLLAPNPNGIIWTGTKKASLQRHLQIERFSSKSVKLLERMERMKFTSPVRIPSALPLSNEICHSHSRPQPLPQIQYVTEHRSTVWNRGGGGKKVRTVGDS